MSKTSRPNQVNARSTRIGGRSMKSSRQKKAENARFRSKLKRHVRKGAKNLEVSEAGVSLIPLEEEE